MATAPISDAVTRNDYEATASQTTFPYTFWVKEEQHLDVYVNGVLKALVTDYTIDAVQSVTGGNVIFNSGLNEDDEVAIVLAPEVERQTEFQTLRPESAPAINLEFTYLISLVQWLKTLLSRTLSLSPSDSSSVSLTLPSATAGTVIGWNGTATGFQNYAFADITADINTDITGLTDGDFLQYNATSGLWENTAAPSATVADDSITLTKLAHGAAGNLITYDNTGAPASVDTGTAGQVLTSNGAGLPPTFQASASAPVTSVAGKTGAVTITATDVGLSNVPNVDSQNASNLTSGTVNTTRLGTGTADSTTFLRGDGTWGTPSSSVPTTYNAVGTYLLAASGVGTSLSPGSTLSGSNLKPAYYDAGANGFLNLPGSLSGTWRNMGGNVSGTDDVSLWVRIS